MKLQTPKCSKCNKPIVKRAYLNGIIICPKCYEGRKSSKQKLSQTYKNWLIMSNPKLAKLLEDR